MQTVEFHLALNDIAGTLVSDPIMLGMNTFVQRVELVNADTNTVVA